MPTRHNGVVNIQNDDDHCFEWCVLAGLHPISSHPERISHYKKYRNELDFKGINFPVSSSEMTIRKFERQNSNILIAIYTWKNNGLTAIRIPPKESNKQLIRLLLISDGEKQHYCLIKDICPLINRRSKDSHKQYICDWCLSHVTSDKNKHEIHIEDCLKVSKSPQRIESVKENNKVYFPFKLKKRMLVPYHFVSDNESILKPIKVQKGKGEKFQHHIPCSYSYTKIRYDGYSETRKEFSGQDAAKHFVLAMINEYFKVREEYKNPKPLIPLNAKDQLRFNVATHCWICEEEFLEHDIKVRDHCHVTGKYRGPAHQNCNLQLKIEPGKIHIPVIFHNGTQYDNHIVMQGIGAIECKQQLNCIPKNYEKYLSYRIGNLRFIDSMEFMKISLEKFAENIGSVECKTGKSCNHLFRIDDDRCFNNVEKFNITRKHVKPELLIYYLKKGVFPYDWFDSFEKFNVTSLPSKEEFYSKLHKKGITDEQYNYAQKVWHATKCKTFKDYHDVYLATDVLLLADCIQEFRRVSYETYGLDALWYYSAPGLFWDALFKVTKQRLELMTDLNMILFIEKGMRGGISMVSLREAIANNEYCPNFNPSDPKSWILYIDANNLYGWAMMQCLPTGNFQWLTEYEINNLKFNDIKSDAKTGYILEVDLKYPKELHPKHTDYPLAPESLEVPREWVGEYTESLIKRNGGKYIDVKKLVPNLHDKKKYIIHYRNLQYYLSQGMILEKIHRVISFDQSAWMKPYIEFNTRLRAKATTTFEKDFYKLANNSVFGKSMENLRKRQKVELIQPQTNPKRYRKLIADPLYKGRKIFYDNLVAVHLKKAVIKMERPIYIGFSVLELSKLCMYQFYYDILKMRYGDNVELAYTDTDSLLVKITTENVYKDLTEMAEYFDFSDYPKDHEIIKSLPENQWITNGTKRELKNKKIPGLFKDEYNGKIIVEFIGLKPKMYSILLSNEDSRNPKHGGRKAKGVPKSIVKSDFTHERYKKVLHEEILNDTVKFNTIRSEKHELYTMEVVKLGLSPIYTKKYVMLDKVHTLAYGDYRITNNN
jgi:hypothetical protein